jgi:lipopolysaccharide export system permease protein
MKIYVRHLIYNLITTSIVLNCVFLALISLMQILKFMYLINKGALLSDVIDVVILSMPSLLFTILPISSCLSIGYSYFKCINLGEVTLLRIMGLSNFKIATPGLFASVIATGLMYCMTLTISPVFFTRLKNLTFELRNNYALDLIQADSFNMINKDVTIYVGKKVQQDSFDNILVFDKSDNAKIFVAQKGSLRFIDGMLNLVLQNGVAQTVDHNLQFDQFIAKIDLFSNKAARITKDLEEYTLDELLASPKLKLQAQGHKLIIWPLYTLLLTSFVLSALLTRNILDLKVKICVAIYTLMIIAGYFGLYLLSTKNSYFLYLQYVFAFSVLLVALFRIRAPRHFE